MATGEIHLCRWLSPDPAGLGAVSLSSPQSWNAYSYALNNPTTKTDPTGLYTCADDNNKCQTKGDRDVAAALAAINQAANKLKPESSERQSLQGVLNFYGTAGEKNGVTIKFGDLHGRMDADTSTSSLFGLFKHTTITFDLGEMRKTLGAGAGVNQQVEFGAVVAHEGQHGVDQWANGMPKTFNQYVQTETNAFTTQSYVNRALGTKSPYQIWDPTWNPALAEPLSKAAIASQAQIAASCDYDPNNCR